MQNPLDPDRELMCPVAQAIERLRQRVLDGTESENFLILEEEYLESSESVDPELDDIARMVWAGVDEIPITHKE